MTHHKGLVHKEYDWRDSNVEFINSDIDHKVKYQSANTEPAWKNSFIGVNPGLYIWRVEDFQVVPWPKEATGSFYDGDSYIILHSESVKVEGQEAKLVHDIFFWLGKYTTQDEAGTAAYKTVELDEFLHGAATQHRELQASPSDAFLHVFPRLKILRGGVKSGFTHVDLNRKPQHVDTLLRVFKHPSPTAGREAVLVHEVELDWKSLDEGDVFVLDKGEKIYVWQGKKCSPMEKMKAAQVVNDLTIAKHINVEVLSQTEARSKIFVDYLGGQDLDLLNTEFRATRPISMVTERDAKKLFRLSDAQGNLSFDLVKEGKGIGKGDLDSDDVFLLDIGRSIWVWEGKGASAAERTMWLKILEKYISTRQDAAEVSFAKVRQGNEARAFWTAIGT